MPSVVELRQNSHQFYRESFSDYCERDGYYFKGSYAGDPYFSLKKAIAIREDIPEQERNDEDYLALSIYYFDLADITDGRPGKESDWARQRSAVYRGKIKHYEALDYSGYNKKFASVQSFPQAKFIPQSTPIGLMADEVIALARSLRKKAAKESQDQAAQTFTEVMAHLNKAKSIIAGMPASAELNSKIKTIDKLLASSRRREGRVKQGLFQGGKEIQSNAALSHRHGQP